MHYDRQKDQYVGSEFPGHLSHGFVRYALDEMELGGRVAMSLDDPDQAFWVLTSLDDIDSGSIDPGPAEWDMDLEA